MKKSLVLLVLNFQCLIFNCFSQPAIQWQKTIGGSLRDEFYSILQTSDGGYIMGGVSNSNISGDKTENTNGYNDFWIIKTDSSGVIQWQNTIGGSDIDEFYSIQQTSDGGFIIGGSSQSNMSGDKTENSKGHNDYWLVKTDASGNIQWQNTIGGKGHDYLRSLRQTSDGGYILCGDSHSNISGDKMENSIGVADYWLVKTDGAGIIQWENTIGGNYYDDYPSIQQTSDGGYIIGGSSESNISGDKTENSIGDFDYWLVKTDATGNIQWQNTIGGSGLDNLNSIQQTSDGGYILGGASHSDISGDKTENSIGDFDYWLVKTDASGNVEWQNTIGGNGFDQLNSVQQTSDGGYILGGVSNSDISGDKTENSIGGYDYWIIKTNASGNIQWQNTIGGNNWDGLCSIQQTSDGGYIAGGYSESNISGDKTENNWDTTLATFDYWILKFFPDTITGIADSRRADKGYVISPNPVSNSTTISFTLSKPQNISLRIIDVNGRLISIITDKIFETGKNEIAWDAEDINAGIYFLQFQSEEITETKKLIITK